MCRTDNKNEKNLIVHVIISNSDSSWNLTEQVFVFTNMQIFKDEKLCSLCDSRLFSLDEIFPGSIVF